MRRFVLVAFALLLAEPASAQSYPDHPIRVIVPTPADRPVNAISRLTASAAARRRTSPVTSPENRRNGRRSSGRSI
jgi:tripartite-type tricarboxylate transporter receptor subunit TctC